MKERFPLISFIIPVYNAEKYLDLCLKSIVKQDYSQNRIEVLIVDGGSQDNTLNIARNYNTIVLHNEKKIAEYGKALGIKASKGKFFILMDSDNEIAENDWLKKMIKPVLENPDLFGVESPLSYDNKLSSLNRYFARMRIADPLAKYLASQSIEIERRDGYDILKFSNQNVLITGANGFLWNKRLVMETLGWSEKFEEANYSIFIHSKIGANYAIPSNVSIRHYYCGSILEYLKKRKKIAIKVRNRIMNREFSWTKKISKIKMFIVILYLLSFIAPLLEAIYRSIKDRTIDWFWHPLISFLTIATYSYIFSFNWREKKTRKTQE